ncbi:CRISPR-associated helicase Cas3' [Neptunicella sp.]|uniref:CRISPR-associated helicase Cas3' n=1 Tax=Neptunicella sp. TaxID=2125986 RepID=UPI003F6939EC
MNSENIAPYFKYWGKAKKDPGKEGADYHLLVYHCLDVAAVGKCLLDVDKAITKDLSKFLEVSPKQVQDLIVFFLVFHDLGKFASAFQQLYSVPNNQLITVESCYQYNGKEYRHDRMGLYFWQKLREDIFAQLFNIDEFNQQNPLHVNALKSLMVIMDCMLGHHGQPINKNDPQSIAYYTEEQNLRAVKAFLVDVIDLLAFDFPLEKIVTKQWRKKLELVSWQIAGVTVLADWIGSDQFYFKYQSTPKSLSDYWQSIQKVALQAIGLTDLDQVPPVKPFESIQAHFGYSPTPLQRWAETIDIDDMPQLFILEDVTGAGKTEAALALTHRLMQAGAADGFYFGLPTMATSNAMFSRVAKNYQQMLSGSKNKQPSIVLAHGAREMNDLFRDVVLASGVTDQNYEKNDNTATAQCNEWLADSRKKALLAPVGVGTIDQALLAVLPRRHQSLRLLGLNRKVLIFDEVHAADEFMFELLESLLALHLHQGGSVILLTATLSLKQRQRLTDIWLKEVNIGSVKLREQAFPLATRVKLDNHQPILEQPLASRADVSRSVAVEQLTNIEQCIQTIIEAVTKGQCVVWVRNAVNDALEAYQLLQKHLKDPEQCLLFHSRFVLSDRKVIENRVLDIFGKAGNRDSRAGKVLIATQVFQESLDADADLMISDICPIDDLIQRAGRLHRHTRNAQGEYQAGITDCRSEPILYLHAPTYTDDPQGDWLSTDFRNTQYVYRSAGRLWLGLKKLLELGAIRMPEQARQLIEAVYSDEALAQIPQSLINQEHELFADELAKANKAKSNLLQWQSYGYCDQSAKAWHEDSSDISTRYSDIEMIEVLLLKQNASGALVPWIEDEKFAVQLSTVKLSKNKYADKLLPIPEQLSSAVEVLKQQYKYIDYLQLWLPECDPNFAYHPTTGFCEIQKEDLL